MRQMVRLGCRQVADAVIRDHVRKIDSGQWVRPDFRASNYAIAQPCGPPPRTGRRLRRGTARVYNCSFSGAPSGAPTGRLRLRIVILGAGQVGSSVAESLVSEQNDITVVDVDGGRLRALQERFALRTVTGARPAP